MADRDVVSRAGKEAALNIADHDQNLNAYLSTSEEQTGATYEVVYTDHGKLIELNNASMTCTLDAIADIVAAMDSGVDNFSVTLKNTNAAAATIERSSTDTIDGKTSIILNTNETLTLQTNAADDEWLQMSDGLSIYSGYVIYPSPGSGSELPDGWSAASSGTGIFTITHTLGTNRYSASATAITGTAVVVTISALQPTYITFRLYDSAGVLIDRTFDFIIKRW